MVAQAGVAEGLEDPTRPPVRAGSAETTVLAATRSGVPQFSSVITGPGGSIAILNGSRYRCNDWVGDYQLTAIGTHSVVLLKDGERTEISLPTSMDEVEVIL